VASDWERAADQWAAHVRGGGDASYEWNAPAFFDLLPPPRGLTIDVGCGEGRTTRDLRDRGYAATGVDAQPKLIELARGADPGAEYFVADAAALPLDDSAAALVVAFMVLQDLLDLDGAVAEAGRVLEPHGHFCFAIVHPVASDGDFGDAGDDTFVLRSYCMANEVPRPLGTASITQFHRSLEAYSLALERNGFLIEALREVPTRRRAPGRIPAFLHVRALKP
jgi:SAM-dependent methyltransferase